MHTKITTRKKVSVALNALIGVAALTGVLLSIIFAQRDGYSHWTKRLLYFTQQSNIWIGVTCLVIAVLSVIETYKGKPCIKGYVYVLKYIFTVSITITGIIFCVLLAPFADYDVWSFASVLVHVVVPILAVADLFLFETEHTLQKKHVLLCLIPPLLYFAVTSVLCLWKVDFGRGDPYPYIFLDFYSDVGFFGIIRGDVPKVGTAYWLALILTLILGLSWVYYAVIKWLKPKQK